MARSKQGSIIERGKGAKKRIYARIRWTERVDGVMTKRGFLQFPYSKGNV